MEEFPEEMRILDTTRVDVAIPGWHINGHGKTCWEKFNLSYMEGAGRTVGEDIETTWAGTNPLVQSVREMGPAAQHDTLNDHWNSWNFRKIAGFHTLLSSLVLMLHHYFPSHHPYLILTPTHPLLIPRHCPKTSNCTCLLLCPLTSTLSWSCVKLAS